MIDPDSNVEGRQHAEHPRFLYHATELAVKNNADIRWLKRTIKNRTRLKRVVKPGNSSTPVPVSVSTQITKAPQRPTGFSIHACTNFRVQNTYSTPKPPKPLPSGSTKQQRRRYEQISRLSDDIPTLISKFYCTFESKKLLFVKNRRGMRFGNHGIVAYYETNTNPKYKLCVKHTTDKKDFEVVRRLQTHNVLCGQVPARIIKNNTGYDNDYYHINGENHPVYAYAMPTYEGTLERFVYANDKDRLTKETLENIIINLHRQLKCLQRHKKVKLCYMDIKPANILFYLDQPGDNTSIQVTLGDLGSENVSSYHCPFASNTRYPDCKEAKEQYCIEYNLIVMLVSLYYKPEDLLQKCGWVLYSGRPKEYVKLNPQTRGESTAAYFERIRRQVIEGAAGFVRQHFENLESILLPWVSRQA